MGVGLVKKEIHVFRASKRIQLDLSPSHVCQLSARKYALLFYLCFSSVLRLVAPESWTYFIEFFLSFTDLDLKLFDYSHGCLDGFLLRYYVLYITQPGTSRKHAYIMLTP